MNILRKIHPELPLRAGLGLMYAYSGWDLMVNPTHWYGFVPRWFWQAVTRVVSIDNYLFLQGAGELLMGLLFFAWFLPRSAVRLVAAAAAVEMALILLFVGIDPITFRDIGLLGGALALLIMITHRDFPKETLGETIRPMK